MAAMRGDHMQGMRQSGHQGLRMARRRGRIDAARKHEHRRVDLGRRIERGGHRPHRPAGADARVLVEQCGADARGRDGRAHGGVGARQVFGADHREMHAFGKALLGHAAEHGCGGGERRIIAVAGLCEGVGQHRARRRHIHRCAQQTDHGLARQRHAVRPAIERIDHCDFGPGRGACEQRIDARAQIGRTGAAVRIGGAGLGPGIERGIGVLRKTGRQDHRGGCHAVEHQGAHTAWKLARVFERGTGAIRGAPQIDARIAEGGADPVEVADRDPGRVLREVDALRAEFVAAGMQARDGLVGVEGVGQRFRFVRRAAIERGRGAGAALVDEDHVAARVQAFEQGQDHARHRLRRLAGAARDHEDRIVGAVGGTGWCHREMDRELACVGAVGIFRDFDLPAAHFAGDAIDTTGAEAGAGLGRVMPRPAGTERCDGRANGRHGAQDGAQYGA